MQPEQRSRRGGRAAVGRRRAILACALLALGILLAGAQSAAAQSDLSEFRLGVSFEAIDGGMGEAGIDSLRIALNWAEIETRRGGGACSASYDWERYDDIVSSASVQGIELLPIIVGSPDYAATKQSELPRLGRAGVERDYLCFVRAAVERYGAGGDYFRVGLGTDPTADPIATWQVWNEPNVKFYAVQVRPGRYRRVLRLTHDQIAAADPRAGVVTAGGPEFPNRGMPWREFLGQVYDGGGIEGSFDAVGLHPYAEDHRGVRGAVKRMRRFLRGRGDAATPLWITEIGWASDGPRAQFPVKGPLGQARQLERAVAFLRDTHARRGIGSVYWFNWRDLSPPRAREGWHHYAGLYDHQGQPKGACRRFVAFTAGSCSAREQGGLLPRPGDLFGGDVLPLPSPPLRRPAHSG